MGGWTKSITGSSILNSILVFFFALASTPPGQRVSSALADGLKKCPLVIR